MTVFTRISTGLLTSCVFLSSCAYMQTHKNIEEYFTPRTGYHINQELELYQAGDHYYLAVDKQTLRVKYPAIHDSIFLKDDNEPEFISLQPDAPKVYMSVSKGTALVLQKNDGYADLSVLSEEMKNTDGAWLDTLPAGARRCTIQAEIAGQPTTWLSTASGNDTPIYASALGTLDRVIIDWPGTVLYNVAIPVMAPFVFFYEFLNEE